MKLPQWLLISALLPACSSEGPPPSTEPQPTPLGALEATLRPDSPRSNDLYTFEEGEVVETFDAGGGLVRVHYTRTGTNAVPPKDGDKSGVPDYVELVAATYEDALAFYELELGFRRPISDETLSENGGDGRFDVYLLDFGGAGDGAFRQDACGEPTADHCVGYMVQENDFKGYGYPSLGVATRILASHELFHAVQAAYDAKQSTVVSEGTAVWATEQFDPSLEDFEAFIGGYLDNPDRPIDKPLPGPVDAFSYGAAIFFEFLSLRHGTDIIRKLWEASENGAGGVPNPEWLPALDTLLQAEYTSSFSSAFLEFAVWNLFTGKSANPAISYPNGATYPEVAKDAVNMPLGDDKLRIFYAASRYLRAPVKGRLEVEAALVPAAGEDPDLSALRLFLTSRTGEVWSAPMSADASLRVKIGTEGASEVVAIVVNTAMGGESTKAAFCLGRPVEVEKCLEKFTGTTEDPDATGGSTDADTGSGADDDGGASEELDAATGESDSEAPGEGAVDTSVDTGGMGESATAQDNSGGGSGGCSAGAQGGSGGAAAIFVGALAWVSRRRRAT